MSRRSGKPADMQSVNSFMKRNQNVLMKIKFALQGQEGPEEKKEGESIKFPGGDDDMDFDKKSKSKKTLGGMSADMRSQYTYNSSEDMSEYDPNRF